MELTYQPASTLPELAAGQLGSGGSGVCFEPPGQVRRFLRHAPEFIDDPDGAAIFDGMGPAIYRSPPVFTAAYDDAELIGYRTLVSGGGFRDDEILVGGAPAEAAYLDKISQPDGFLNEETGLRRVDDARFTLERGHRSERHIPGTSIVLCSHEPSNYGSLLFRVLPKLLTLREMGLGDLPAIVWAQPEAYRHVLATAGLDPSRIVQHDVNMITRLDRAIAPSLRNPHAYFDRQSAAFMQSMSDRFDTMPHGRRIYVSRLRHGKVSGSTRVLLNEDTLAARLADLAFEVIEPERLSFEDQIATFASADMIVGPSGSAMFNAVFCRPGTKLIDIESEPHWMYAHAGLFASCQLRYGLFAGKPDPADTKPVHRRWTVDIDALMDRIATFIYD